MRDTQSNQYDVRFMNFDARSLYVTRALKCAAAISSNLIDGDRLLSAFAPMLRYVILSESPYLGGCHDTSAMMYLQLRQSGVKDADVVLCIGEVKVPDARFDHSWLEVRGQVFDVAICAPNYSGVFAGGPVFAGIDLITSASSQAQFGVESRDPLDSAAAYVHRVSLSQYFHTQLTASFKSVGGLSDSIYEVSGQELLASYPDVKREWRNPLLNP